jgi:hypothetical protein
LEEYGAAQSELIGKAVVLTDGKAGTVENVWLDELHGFGFRSKVMMEDGRSQPSSSRTTRPSHRLRAAQIARSFQSIPIKMKSPTSVRKVTLMIATVRNTSLADTGFMNASHLAKPRE